MHNRKLFNNDAQLLSHLQIILSFIPTLGMLPNSSLASTIILDSSTMLKSVLGQRQVS